MGFEDDGLEDASASKKKNENINSYGTHGDVDHVDHVDEYSQEVPKKISETTSLED